MLLLCVAVLPVAIADDLATVSKRFQAKLDELRHQHGFPGATAAFILPDGRLGVAATGLADKQNEIAMTPESRMLSGSIGKTFVAAVALQLAGEGKLALDKTIGTWLADYDWFERLPGGAEITLRHLLTHSSGLPDHVYSQEYSQAVRSERNAKPDLIFAPERLVGFILDKPLLFGPGRGYGYTDTGYILVGLIIEKVSDEAYYEELQRRFLKPLALELTSPSNTRELPGLAPGHLAADNLFGLPEKNAEIGRMRFNPGTEWTGGGLCSNPRDLVRWAKALYEGRLFESRWQQEIVGSKVPRDTSGERFYGLGVYVSRTPLGTSYGHGGWFPGWRSSMQYFPAHRVAVAIQINTDVDVNPTALAIELAKAVTGDDFWKGLSRESIGLGQTLLVVKGTKGLAGCTYLNLETFERGGEACAIIPAADFDAMLDANVSAATSRAKALGIKVGMPGREALELLR